MATYEDDHNLPSTPSEYNRTTHARIRQSMSADDFRPFFTNISSFSNNSPVNQNSTNPVETATEESDIRISIASAFRTYSTERSTQGDGNVLQEEMMRVLDRFLDGGMSIATRPIRYSPYANSHGGVTDAYLDSLDRVSHKSLKLTDICPICTAPFLSSEYPLVVQLPCHPSHKFDLECLQPWLKVNTTCPMDRKDLLARTEPPPVTNGGEGEGDEGGQEEDYDPDYA